MQLEQKLPDIYRRIAYHPNLYTFAWKKKDLEKLFEELMKWNIAILGGEVWLVDEIESVALIPLKSGDIQEFHWESKIKTDEEWFDFVERSVKDTTGLINEWNLEKESRLDKLDSIWYHFKLAEKP